MGKLYLSYVDYRVQDMGSVNRHYVTVGNTAVVPFKGGHF